MELQIKYNPKQKGNTDAVFIAGSTAAAWLREIDSWQIPYGQLQCYVVPESIRSIKPAGLFVIVSATGNKAMQQLPAYTAVTGRLYIPASAALYPAVTKSELEKILLWKVQFFHPTIGLVGFEPEDRIDLLQLIQLPVVLENRWQSAPAAITVSPLQSIRVQRDEVQDLLESFKKEIGVKPIEEIPGKPAPAAQAAKMAGNRILYYLLAAIMFIPMVLGTLIALLVNLLPKSNSPSAPPASYRSPSWLEGFLGNITERTTTWIKKTMEELQKERDSEINRLMNLFETDPDEALKYAIPLSSMYQGRGTTDEGSKLTRQDSLFNMRGLGGGQVRSVWNIGDRANDLRIKYIKAAEQELKRGNYKRAAYIYTNLLGDYNSAANALMQGKFYREAAALYKDHLHRKQAAANCLEKGGLLEEAIELYIELNNYEKAGDLYTVLGQNTKAEACYAKCVESALQVKNYLEVARLQHYKLNNTAEAFTTLMLGWEENIKPAECLTQYYTLKQQTGETEVVADIEAVYKKASTSQQKNMLLDVMQQVNKLYPGKTTETTTNIAYEIISEQANAGNLTRLSVLANYTEDDQLVTSDCSRYIHLHKKQTAIQNVVSDLRLNKDVKWFKAMNVHNCVYSFGISQGRLIFSRTNWYNNTDYCIWNEPLAVVDKMVIAVNALQKNSVVIYYPTGNGFYDKKLQANKYFDFSLNLYTCAYLPADMLAVGVDNINRIAAVVRHDDGASLNHYNTDNSLVKTTDCTGDFARLNFYTAAVPMTAKAGGFYFKQDDVLFFISNDGDVRSIDFDSTISYLAISHLLGAPKFIISCTVGVLFVTDANGQFALLGDSSEMGIISAVFISDTCAAAASGHCLTVYTIDGAVSVKQQIEVEETIVAVLTTNQRNEIALLLENGEMKKFAIEE